ncbi:hypothetical protein BDF19DRAFT_453626 [Syncephalis fuscata]|nr:hypothetical protein BDF19DRAFT_453626 [Syncephalis fuscata]
MVRFISIGILLLAIAALATAQPKSTDSGSSANISIECQKTLNSTDVSPPCNNHAKDKESIELNKFCSTPDDNTVGRRCSAEQVTKALDALKKDCKKELESSVKPVKSRYKKWMKYPVTSTIKCLKNSEGSYCNSGSEDSEDPQIQSDKCNDCDKAELQLWIDWNPQLTTNYEQKAYKKLTADPFRAAKQCNIKSSNSIAFDSESKTKSSSASAPKSFGAVVIATVAALMFNV